MLIRPAILDDAPAIARAHVDAWRAAYRDILPGEYLAALSVERREAMWSTILSSPGAVVLVAVDGEEIVGFASAAASRDEDVDRTRVGEIGAIYLVERAWSRGLGARLFDAALVALRDAGFEEVVLWVLEENMRARAFYERKGMTVDPSRPLLLTVDGVDHREIRYRTRLAR
jgi:GNAT superfamily N-acetyltransferase